MNSGVAFHLLLSYRSVLTGSLFKKEIKVFVVCNVFSIFSSTTDNFDDFDNKFRGVKVVGWDRFVESREECHDFSCVLQA